MPYVFYKNLRVQISLRVALQLAISKILAMFLFFSLGTMIKFQSPQEIKIKNKFKN